MHQGLGSAEVAFSGRPAPLIRDVVGKRVERVKPLDGWASNSGKVRDLLTNLSFNL